MSGHFGLKLGAFAPEISVQLSEQGFRPKNQMDGHFWQGDREAIKRLEVRGIMTNGEADKARRRLMRQISDGIEPIE